MEPFANPVRLGILRFGPGVVDVLNGQIQFILMSLGGAAVLGAPIRDGSIQRNLVLIEERRHPIIENLGSRDRRFLVIQLGKPDFAVKVCGL